MATSSAQIVRLSCASRGAEGSRSSLRIPASSLSPRQRLVVTHLLDLAKYLTEEACPGGGEADAGLGGEANVAYRPYSGRRSDAMGLFRRALAMANACCLESVRRGLLRLRDEERRGSDQSRAEALNALLSEVDLRLSVFRDLRIGGSTD